jgi:hypothetical protein
MYSVRGSARLWVDMLLVCYSLGIGVELETAGETEGFITYVCMWASRKPGRCRTYSVIAALLFSLRIASILSRLFSHI